MLCGCALAIPACADAQDIGTSDIAGGGSLPYTTTPRGYRPSLGIVLRVRAPQLAVRFDTTLLCGRDSFDVQGRSVVPFNDANPAAPIATQGTAALAVGPRRRLEYAWRVTVAMAPGQASGTLHITGTLHTRGRTTACGAVPDRPWLVRASIPPSAPEGAPPPGATFFGSTSQDLGGGLPGGVIVRVTRDGRKIAARWTAVARCARGPRELLANFTPPTALRGATFSRSERFTQRFTDALVRYRVRFFGRTAADGASGGFRLQARVFDARGRRLHTTCDSGLHGWNATALQAAAPPPAAAQGTSSPVAPPPPGSDLPLGTTVPGVWSLHMTSDPGDSVGAGGTYALDPSNHRLNIVSAEPGHIRFAANSLENFTSWEGDFAAPPGQALAAATTYTGVMRYPSNGSAPGMDVSGLFRGCSTLSGTFTVDAIAFDPDRALRTFIVRFEQHCQLARPALRGTFEFHAA